MDISEQIFKKVKYSDKSEYEGYFLNNLRHGKGIYKWENVNLFFCF